MSISEPDILIGELDDLGYVVDRELATVLYLMLRMEKPLLLEGNPGVGKTEVAQILSKYLGYRLIRLQCYEGLDVNNAIYEWNYQKQLLSIKLQEKEYKSLDDKEAHIFSDDFILKRPLLDAITSEERVVLLIDEVDRSDEEFEAYLLELLSAFQISIPEIGTIAAKYKPIVVLTSNRTRELSDALKRRCLYHWVEYPDMSKELKILEKHVPNINTQLAEKIASYVDRARKLNLDRRPGIAETIDWARAIDLLGGDDQAMVDGLSSLLKSQKDKKIVMEEIFVS